MGQLYPILGLKRTYALLSEYVFKDFLMLHREMENWKQSKLKLVNILEKILNNS